MGGGNIRNPSFQKSMLSQKPELKGETKTINDRTGAMPENSCHSLIVG